MPTRVSDPIYDYTFKGWNTTVPSSCTGSTTYIAQFTATVRRYTIQFADWDGTVLSSTVYEYGSTVTPPDAPKRDSQYGVNYYFDSWDKEIATVTGDAVYTAVYRSSVQEYTITFQDWDGTLLSQTIYYYGNAVNIPQDPVRAEDASNTYVFRGWNISPTIVTCDMTYTATYIAIPKNYCVMFYDWDGRLLFLKADYRWGEAVYEPPTLSTPQSENPLAYAYVFSHWSAGGGADDFSSTVFGNATYTAQYAKEYIDYTVTFLDWDGTVLSERTDYHWGDAVTAPADPYRIADDTYLYSFVGWSPAVEDTVTGNVTYTAQYDKQYIAYTVTFLDWDGTVLSEQIYHYGDSLNLPNSPTRPETAETVYSFSHWSPSVTGTVTGNAVYTAVYAENVAEHTIVFKDWDDSILQSETLPYGDRVTAPADPYRIADDTYLYSFVGWSPKVEETVKGGATYVAQYQATYRDYTVTFLDWDGTVLSEQTYHWGDTVSEPTPQGKSDDNIYTYRFVGWDASVTSCAGDMVYTAVYAPSYQLYTVTFLDWDGTPLLIRTDYHWGDSVSVPQDPIRVETEQYTYSFVGWTPSVENAVAGNASYTALYDMTAKQNEFTVTFLDWDGTVLSEQTYHEGEVVVFPADPSRSGEDGVEYSFSHWEGGVDVGGGMTYTAVYAMTYRGSYTRYTVIFKDYDDTELACETYESAAEIVLPETPERAEDNIYSYRFTGWLYAEGHAVMPLALHESTEDFVAVYTAHYTATYRAYTVTFLDWDGTVLSEQSCHYGDSVAVPTDPIRSGYRFIGWDSTVTELCMGNATYTARYEQEQSSSDSSGWSGGFGWSGSARPSGSAPSNSDKSETEEDMGGADPLAGYEDVPEYAWYRDALIFCIERGLMEGVSETAFAPEADVSRAELVKIFWLLSGSPDSETESTYTDVPADAEEMTAIRWAASIGLFRGYGDGRFGYENLIRREQAFTAFCRYAAYCGLDLTVTDPDVLSAYADAETVSGWARPAMEYMCSSGLVIGTLENQLAPQGYITRAQIATLLMRFCALIEEV